MLYGIENYADGSKGATSVEWTQLTLTSSPQTFWAAGGNILVVLGVVGTFFAADNITGTGDTNRLVLTMGAESYTPAVLAKNVAGGLSIKINESYGPGWKVATPTDLTIQTQLGYTGTLIFSGFVLGRLG
jgi:hypothetical protein